MINITDSRCYVLVTSENVIDVLTSVHEVMNLEGLPYGDGKRYLKIPGWFVRKLKNSDLGPHLKWDGDSGNWFDAVLTLKHEPPRDDVKILIGGDRFLVWDVEFGYAEQFKQTIHCLAGLG